ncbi:MAG TPA: molybdopterin converting factor subunit 1 [Tepidisphaeraceae bacterium]|jgi:molybdopterin converting factor subunit 1|nr:molybdopterin converting factor subunit 1 [Tepidisphaeraceae bacterium]
MKITIRLFAILRERAGISSMALDLPADATVAAAKAALLRQYPQLGDLMSRTAFAVNQAYAPADAELNDGDEVAFLPPVSGG